MIVPHPGWPRSPAPPSAVVTAAVPAARRESSRALRRAGRFGGELLPAPLPAPLPALPHATALPGWTVERPLAAGGRADLYLVRRTGRGSDVRSRRADTGGYAAKVFRGGPGVTAADRPWYVMPYYAAGAMWDGTRWAEPYVGRVDRVMAVWDQACLHTASPFTLRRTTDDPRVVAVEALLERMLTRDPARRLPAREVARIRRTIRLLPDGGAT